MPPGAGWVTWRPVPLLDALRAVTAFAPPAALPGCDLALLGDVLAAHGLAPLASYQVETTPLGAGLPAVFRERLLGHYQAVVNDNVLKLVTLRGVLKAAHEVPVVLLGGAAYVDWLYPHMAFRPVGDLRIALRAEDLARFREALQGSLSIDHPRTHVHLRVISRSVGVGVLPFLLLVLSRRGGLADSHRGSFNSALVASRVF